MGEPHVIGALRAKRAETAGALADLAKEAARRRADLQHVDATLRLFAPDFAPEDIKPKRQYKRNAWFGRGEGTRLAPDILRAAERPLTAIEIAQELMAAKKIDASVKPRANCSGAPTAGGRSNASTALAHWRARPEKWAALAEVSRQCLLRAMGVSSLKAE
jgi:hypothetical protein